MDVYQEDDGAFVQEIQVIFSSIRFSRTVKITCHLFSSYFMFSVVAWAVEASSQLACTFLLLLLSVGFSNTAFLHIKPCLAVYDLLNFN